MSDSALASTPLAALTCPKCGTAGEAQPCHAVHAAGTSTTESKTTGGAVIWGPSGQLSPVFASGKTSGTTQTQLAAMCAPPKPIKEPAYVTPGMVRFAYVTILLVTCGLGIIGYFAYRSSLAEAERKARVPRPHAWPAPLDAWKRRWVCMRCHHIIDPDPRYSVEALNAQAAETAAVVAATPAKRMGMGKLILIGSGVSLALLLVIGAVAKPDAQSFVPPSQPAPQPSRVTPSAAKAPIANAPKEGLVAPVGMAPKADEATIGKYKAVIEQSFAGLLDSRSATAKLGEQVFWAPVTDDAESIVVRLDPDLKISSMAYLTKEEAEDGSIYTLPLESIFLRPARLVQYLSGTSLDDREVARKIVGAFVSARSSSDFQSWQTDPISVDGCSVTYSATRIRKHGDRDLIGLFQIDVRITPSR